MKWYVQFGKGRMVRPSGTKSLGQGWTLELFNTQDEARAFAENRVKEGFTVDVGEFGSNTAKQDKTTLRQS